MNAEIPRCAQRMNIGSIDSMFALGSLGGVGVKSNSERAYERCAPPSRPNATSTPARVQGVLGARQGELSSDRPLSRTREDGRGKAKELEDENVLLVMHAGAFCDGIRATTWSRSTSRFIGDEGSLNASRCEAFMRVRTRALAPTHHARGRAAGASHERGETGRLAPGDGGARLVGLVLTRIQARRLAARRPHKVPSGKTLPRSLGVRVSLVALDTIHAGRLG